ncbi:hypothetical protein ACFWU5_09760 [Nocardia sp. NPDC058640]|uniref:hypothetical protein n=1 Tax=Nocardia sp. NPDC058640 TaxID=3346571 RepID=UPI00364EA24E
MSDQEDRPEFTTEGKQSNVVRLPKRPRRGREDSGEGPRRTWFPDPVDDPAQTRPVTRAELQRETETRPLETVDHDDSVIDLAASRRKRANTPPGVARPMVRPRRIGRSEDRSQPDGPVQQP